MNTSGEFIDTVQMHERAWGSDTYPKRPDLNKFLSAKVVVFWKHDKEERWRATIHPDMLDVEAELTKMLLRIQINPTKRSIAKIYANGKQVCIKGVKIKFAYCETDA
jgi:hypothetical protein